MRYFKENILAQYGSDGQQWLDALPERITFLAKKYGLSNLTPADNLSFNYILKGKQAGKLIALKLGMDILALKREAEALRCFDGQGVVKLLASDDSVILMEQLSSGYTLKTLFPGQDERATDSVCGLIKTIHAAPIPDQHSFQSVSELCARLDAQHNLPTEIVDKARLLRDDLLFTTPTHVLLHGDLHHENILQKEGEWVAIDPKGFVGDPAFELAAYLSNPMPELIGQANPYRVMLDRARRAASLLDMPLDRIMGWHTVKSVLCWLWAVDDGVDAGYWEQLVESLIS